MLKVVVAEPAGTVIVAARTGSSALLLNRETAVPAATAAVRVTVHVALAPEVRLVGLHVSEEGVTAVTKLMAAILETLFRVAVSVALLLLKTAHALALKVAVAEPAGTVIVGAGTNRYG